MCGFAGFFSGQRSTSDGSTNLTAMGLSLTHRGPDAQGLWQGGSLGVGLVHRRLAIQDLSPAGAQPMVSASGRFVVAFNGEIYNFRQLRTQLASEGYRFRGHSDTEVMLAAFEAWGVRQSLTRFVGMFAFALVDQVSRQLVLARDRMGEKPLYYGWQNATLLFGSELKALRAHPAWQGQINRQALPLLLRHNAIPAPHSVFQGVCKLMPASLISFDLEHAGPGQLPAPEYYWQPEQALDPARRYSKGRAAASAELEGLLSGVIADQMVSDVPLGAFLSGGIDSSTVVALMQQQACQPVRSFSIGFDEPGFNEAEHAKAVAAHLGTHHTELYVSAKEALQVIPELPVIYDEPFADSSQIPTFLVSQMTREHVTVALSGDGGDELFCGYTRYPGTVAAWQKRHGAKSRARRWLSSLPPRLSAPLIRHAVPSQRHRSTGAVAVRLGNEKAVAGAGSLSAFYRQKVSYWPDTAQALVYGAEPDYALTGTLPEQLANDPLKTLMWRDLHWYLPDDILTKVDRAAMACSLETRIPMLDHRIVEFALSLPTSLNMQTGAGKQVLRDVLFRHVPRQLVERPKQGFAVPLGAWLRRELRDWAEHLLQPSRLQAQGFLHSATVRWFWSEHLSGREDYSFELWGILMFQAWWDQWQEGQHHDDSHKG